MAITSKQAPSQIQSNFVTGSWLDNGTVKKSVFNLGFKPRHVKILNSTDATVWEWMEGMAADSAIKTVTLGTTTVETSNGITVGEISVLASAPVTMYENTKTLVGVPGTAPADKTDNSRVTTLDEKVYGFSVPAALAVTNKQFRYFAAE